MKKKELFIVSCIFLMAFSAKAQVATCELYAISDITIDTSGSTNKMEITINSSDSNIVHLNYPYIDFVLNGNNDTVANGTFFYFYAHPDGQTQTYEAPTSLNVLPVNFDYLVSLAYVDLSNNYNDTSCILSFSQIASSLNNLALEPTALEIYPNPVQQQSVTISFNADQYIKPNLSIYDLQGRIIVKKLNITANQTEIDVSNFPKGVYYARLMDENGKYGLGKIVIQ